MTLVKRGIACLGLALLAILFLGLPAARAQVFTAGTCDNYALPTDPTNRNPAITSFYSPPATFADFDDATHQRFVTHTFTGLPPLVCGCTLTIVAKTKPDIPSNDSLNLKFAAGSWAYGQLLADIPTPGTGWDEPSSRTFVLDCTALPKATPANPSAPPVDITPISGSLDVMIQDDTIVDCMTLTVSACPPVCGNNIVEGPTEECDGTDDAACPGLCQTDCSCPEHCKFNAGKAKKYQTDMVRAFTECVAPDSTNVNGLLSCRPPVPLSPYLYKEPCKGMCKVQISRGEEKPCKAATIPPGAACCNCKIKAQCKYILEPDGVTLINGGSAAGWTLAMVWRVTGDDPVNGDMTAIDYPLSIPFPTGGGGNLALLTDCNTVLTALGISPMPLCSSTELVDVAVVDPDGNRFAVPGWNCCGK